MVCGMINRIMKRIWMNCMRLKRPRTEKARMNHKWMGLALAVVLILTGCEAGPKTSSTVGAAASVFGGPAASVTDGAGVTAASPNAGSLAAKPVPLSSVTAVPTAEKVGNFGLGASLAVY